MRSVLVIAALSTSLFTTVLARQSKCSASSISHPKVLGTNVVDISAKEVKNHDQWQLWPFVNLPLGDKSLDFCNVTITYTHPGWNDSVNIYLQLPLKTWNGRFIGSGGGGFSSGIYDTLASGVSLGYATATTDGGVDIADHEASVDGEWTLLSPGVPNWPLLYNLATIAVEDMTKISKAVVESFYGSGVKFSYWNGCSTGGRQGLLHAQRYPENYDGIMAAAPAVNWASLLVMEHLGQLVMHEHQSYPAPCEFHAITAAAIKACDLLDGVEDGLVAAHGLCNYDPSPLIGKEVDCTGKTRKISKAAVAVAKALWEGPISPSGTRQWYGIPHETELNTEALGPIGGLAMTTCDASNENCSASPFPISWHHISRMVEKDASLDASTFTRDDFFRVAHKSRQQFLSTFDTSDPDLSAFRARGGKLLHWHGIADQVIPINGSSDYFTRAAALDPNIREFYRYFEVPGVQHCGGGPGPFPDKVWQTLVDWVEKGTAPERIDTRSPDGKVRRPACVFPLVPAYKGGDPDAAESFECAETFDRFGPPKQPVRREVKDEL